jgi:hypothetical protein
LIRTVPTGTSHLRLVWPQWQSAGTESIRTLAPEFPFDVARRGYSVGTKVLQAVLPEHDGPTAVVPIEMSDAGLEERDGIEVEVVALTIAEYVPRQVMHLQQILAGFPLIGPRPQTL